MRISQRRTKPSHTIQLRLFFNIHFHSPTVSNIFSSYSFYIICHWIAWLKTVIKTLLIMRFLSFQHISPCTSTMNRFLSEFWKYRLFTISKLPPLIFENRSFFEAFTLGASKALTSVPGTDNGLLKTIFSHSPMEKRVLYFLCYSTILQMIACWWIFG